MSGVLALYNESSKSNLAVYWGQNSVSYAAGNLPRQDRLSSYCKNSTDVDIFIISFVVDPINGPLLNFANQGANCTPNNNPLICPEIGEDITECQNEHQKTILLSIGGSGANFKFETAEQAESNAQDIWNIFGRVNATSGAKRPFGNATVNGFDLDIEHDAGYVLSWANAMRKLMGDKHYLSAAPQCPAPATNPLKKLLEGTKLDMFFVQYYNNPNCAFEGLEYNSSIVKWNEWAVNNGTRFFMGLPADESATTSGGYLGLDKMQVAVGEMMKKESFGGVMLWDASQAWGNRNYHAQVKNILTKGLT